MDALVFMVCLFDSLGFLFLGVYCVSFACKIFQRVKYLYIAIVQFRYPGELCNLSPVILKHVKCGILNYH